MHVNSRLDLERTAPCFDRSMINRASELSFKLPERFIPWLLCQLSSRHICRRLDALTLNYAMIVRVKWTLGANAGSSSTSADSEEVNRFQMPDITSDLCVTPPCVHMIAPRLFRRLFPFHHISRSLCSIRCPLVLQLRVEDISSTHGGDMVAFQYVSVPVSRDSSM
jgi:hypothetical protein